MIFDIASAAVPHRLQGSARGPCGAWQSRNPADLWFDPFRVPMRHARGRGTKILKYRAIKPGGPQFPRFQSPCGWAKVARVCVRRMKTKWGSCNPLAHTVLLNTDLAKKPPDCLE